MTSVTTDELGFCAVGINVYLSDLKLHCYLCLGSYP